MAGRSYARKISGDAGRSTPGGNVVIQSPAPDAYHRPAPVARAEWSGPLQEIRTPVLDGDGVRPSGWTIAARQIKDVAGVLSWKIWADHDNGGTCPAGGAGSDEARDAEIERLAKVIAFFGRKDGEGYRVPPVGTPCAHCGRS